MTTPMKVNDIIQGSSDALEVVQKYETVDALWGLNHIKLTDNDIKTLREGKYLYTDDGGEYAILISYAPQERSEE